MADLIVDGPGLDGLLSTLHSSSDDMSEATGALRSAATSGLGHHDLESAGDHFADEWGYGIGQLHKAASNVAKQLEEGIRSYTDADNDLASMLTKHGGKK